MTADIDIKKVDKEVKVVLVGESGVGKSSIALRFVNNNFKTITASTIGASFVSKAIIHRGVKIRYNIWDTAGQEKYRSLASMYYKGAECAIIAYDVTNRDSFEQAQKYWVSEVETQLGRNPCLCLAANKVDLEGCHLMMALRTTGKILTAWDKAMARDLLQNNRVAPNFLITAAEFINSPAENIRI